ncbi:MAG: 50S ribosomal protein L20 [Planctomycetes bacterium]|nr:50S ribosomal protein L20 [Planctomycetota bacterium]
MPRATSGAATARKKRRLRKATKGYFLSRSKQTRTMIHAVMRAGVTAYRDRRRKKRDYRSLWVTRITAACRARGVSYSRFMAGLRKASIILNRKMLSELAICDEAAFDKIVAMATA